MRTDMNKSLQFARHRERHHPDEYAEIGLIIQLLEIDQTLEATKGDLWLRVSDSLHLRLATTANCFSNGLLEQFPCTDIKLLDSLFERSRGRRGK